MSISYQYLTYTEQDALIASVGGIIFSLAAGVFSIEPERDSNNAVLRSLPVCLPNQLVKINPYNLC